MKLNKIENLSRRIVFAMLAVGLFIVCEIAGADTLAIPQGVTEIEDEAFYGDISLDEVVLPDGITRIGEKAFANSGLKQIYLPDDLEDIADDAFDKGVTVIATEGSNAYAWAAERGFIKKTSPLSDFSFTPLDDDTCEATKYLGKDEIVVMPAKDAEGRRIVSIGESFMRYNGYVKHIELPSQLISIGKNAFFGCNALQGDLTLPDSIKYIGDWAFYSCKNITGEIVFPGELTAIGAHAFSSCSGIEHVVFGNQLQSIGEGAFRDCKNLSGEIIIPSQVSILETRLFSRTNIQGVIVQAPLHEVKDRVFDDCKNLKYINFEKQIDTVGFMAFYGCGTEQDVCVVRLPETVLHFEQEVWEDETVEYLGIDVDQTHMICPPHSKALQALSATTHRFFIDGYPEYILRYKQQRLGIIQYLGNNSIVRIPAIAKTASLRFDTVDTVIIPEGFEDIDIYVDQYSKLNHISFPESMKSVALSFGGGYYDGPDYSGYEMYFELPDHVDSVSVNAYSDESVIFICDPASASARSVSKSSWLARFTTQNDITERYRYNENGELVLTAGSMEKEYVSILDGVGIVGTGAFRNNSNMKALHLPDSVTKIEERAFESCKTLSEVRFSRQLSEIGYRAFYSCSALASIELPDSLSSIGIEAFALCKFASSGNVVLPDGIRELAYNSFGQSYNLRLHCGLNTTTYETLKEVKKEFYLLEYGDAFVFRYEDQLNLTKYQGQEKKVQIPSIVGQIIFGAFASIDDIESVIIPSSVAFIEEHAFVYCPHLSSAWLSSGTELADDAFLGCSDGFTMYGAAGSPAEAYANEYQVSFIQSNDPSEDSMPYSPVVKIDGETAASGTIRDKQLENESFLLSYSARNENGFYHVTAIVLDEAPDFSHNNQKDEAVKILYDDDLADTEMSISLEGLNQGQYVKIAVCAYGGENNDQQAWTVIGLRLAGSEHLRGEFGHDSILMTLGESNILEGYVISSGAAIWRITLTVDGYTPNDDGSNRYTYDDFSDRNLTHVNLSNWAAFTIDTNREPFNVPGEYTVRLWANTLSNPEGVPLDMIAVNVVMPEDNTQEAVKQFKEYKVGDVEKKTLKTTEEAIHAFAKADTSVDEVWVEHENISYALQLTGETENTKTFTGILDMPEEGLNRYSFIGKCTDGSTFIQSASYWMYTEYDESVTFYVAKETADTYDVYGWKNGEATLNQTLTATGEMNGRYYIPAFMNGVWIDKSDLKPTPVNPTNTPVPISTPTPSPKPTATPSSTSSAQPYTPSVPTVTPSPSPTCVYDTNGVHFFGIGMMKDAVLAAKDGSVKAEGGKCFVCGREYRGEKLQNPISKIQYHDGAFSKYWEVTDENNVFLPKSFKEVSIDGDFVVNCHYDFVGAKLKIEGKLTIEEGASAANLAGVTCKDLVVNGSLYLNGGVIDAQNIKVGENGNINTDVTAGAISCTSADISGIVYSKQLKQTGSSAKIAVQKTGILNIGVIECQNFDFQSEVSQIGDFQNCKITVYGKLTVKGDYFINKNSVTVGSISMQKKAKSIIDTLIFSKPFLTIDNLNQSVVVANDITKQSYNASTVRYSPVSEGLNQYVMNKINEFERKHFNPYFTFTTSADKLWEVMAYAGKQAKEEAKKYKTKELCRQYLLSETLLSDCAEKNDTFINESKIMLSSVVRPAYSSIYKSAVKYAIQHGMIESISWNTASFSMEISKMLTARKTFTQQVGTKSVAWTVEFTNDLNIQYGNSKSITGKIIGRIGNTIVYDEIQFWYLTSDLYGEAQKLYEAAKKAMNDYIEKAIDSLYKDATTVLGFSFDDLLQYVPRINGASVFLNMGNQLTTLSNVAADIENTINTEFANEKKLFTEILKFYQAADGVYLD